MCCLYIFLIELVKEKTKDHISGCTLLSSLLMEEHKYFSMIMLCMSGPVVIESITIRMSANDGFEIGVFGGGGYFTDGTNKPERILYVKEYCKKRLMDTEDSAQALCDKFFLGSRTYVFYVL